jgi:3-hydroxymyristoyl/3-hydroxydecanoyl-(acyl carrier protein) dehydratase
VDPEDVSALLRAGKKRRLWTPGSSTYAVDYGRDAVERLLPHRDPFLFVDRITAVDVSLPAIAGVRRISPTDPIFVGHFPGAPIYPGVLQLETMGQLGICLVHFAAQKSHVLAPNATPTNVRALKIHTAVFLAEVLPGDELTVLATQLDANDQTAVCAGQILKGDEIVAYAIMEVYLVES